MRTWWMLKNFVRLFAFGPRPKSGQNLITWNWGNRISVINGGLFKSPVVRISQKVRYEFSQISFVGFPWSLVTHIIFWDWFKKRTWPTDGHLGFWDLKCVITLSQESTGGSTWELKFVIGISLNILEGSYSDFVCRLPLKFVSSYAYYILRLIWKHHGCQMTHLGFWYLKFVIAFSERPGGIFLRFHILVSLGPWWCILHFKTDLKNNMATRRPSWILKVKVCYRYFSENTHVIFLKFHM